MNPIIVILGTAHTLSEPGKCSPDKRLREALYSRMIVSSVRDKLESYGVRAFIDFASENLPKTMITPSTQLNRQRELALRVNVVNALCSQLGKENCLYVSIHVNASGMGNEWGSAHGWSVWVSPKASDKSKQLACCLYDAAERHNLIMRKPKPEQKYWEQSLYVLNRTLCPAVLTENLFQDNRMDVDYLLSDTGRHHIERLHVEGILSYIQSITK